MAMRPLWWTSAASALRTTSSSPSNGNPHEPSTALRYTGVVESYFMLRATFGLLAVFLFGLVLGAEGSRRVPAPAYSASSIVNAASNQAGPIAPNTIVSLYG